MKVLDGKKLRKVVAALVKSECEIGWADYKDCVEAHKTEKWWKISQFCWPCRVRYAMAKDEKK